MKTSNQHALALFISNTEMRIYATRSWYRLCQAFLTRGCLLLMLWPGMFLVFVLAGLPRERDIKIHIICTAAAVFCLLLARCWYGSVIVDAAKLPPLAG